MLVVEMDLAFEFSVIGFYVYVWMIAKSQVTVRNLLLFLEAPMYNTYK